MDGFLASGQRNRKMEVDSILNRKIYDDNGRVPNNEEKNWGNGHNRSLHARIILQPLGISFISNRFVSKTRETTIAKLVQPKLEVLLKNKSNCILITIISNKKSASN